MNENGILNLSRFEKFLKHFAKNDRKCFIEKLDDELYLASKRNVNEVSLDEIFFLFSKVLESFYFFFLEFIQ